MKKIMMTLAAVMSMTMAFADSENVKAAKISNVYDMSVNIRRLAVTLGLNLDQMEWFGDLHKSFCAEMIDASVAPENEKSEKVEEAVNKNLTYMSYLLNDKQYDKYAALMDVTLRNRGLKK